jgi:hypothetical protein
MASIDLLSSGLFEEVDATVRLLPAANLDVVRLFSE